MIPRILFLDLEGTLFRIPPFVSETQVAQSAWTTLAARLGEDCLRDEEASKKKWERGEYRNYMEWMDDSVRTLQKHGLTASLFENVIDSLEEVPNIRREVGILREAGSVIAIITGGFKRLADRAQVAIRAHHSLSACEVFFSSETNKVVHWNLLPSDYVGKIDFMKLLIREYGCQSADCAFIGDGNNDALLAEQVGLSIAFNAQPRMRAAATYAIQTDHDVGFSGISELILNH